MKNVKAHYKFQLLIKENDYSVEGLNPSNPQNKIILQQKHLTNSINY